MDFDINPEATSQLAGKELREWLKKGLIIERSQRIYATDALNHAMSFVDSLDDRIMTTTASLHKPVRQTKQQLSGFLQKAPADWMYVSFGERLLAHRVRDYLGQKAGATIQQVATALHFSVRTLSRRLAAEGTHFQAVKDEVRRDLAVQQLTSSDLPLATISGLLGFEDLASFNRAFRNWTGSTPGSYRRGL